MHLCGRRSGPLTGGRTTIFIAISLCGFMRRSYALALSSELSSNFGASAAISYRGLLVGPQDVMRCRE